MRPPLPNRILAVDPGTHYMGTAVLEDGLLVHHSVISIEERRTPHEIVAAGRAAIVRLLDCYQPSVLAIEKTFFGKSPNIVVLSVLTREIQALARSRGIRVVALAPSTVKKEICGDGHGSKWRVAKAVCRHFPQLRVFLGQNRKWKARYHCNMFDAVAVGIVAQMARASELTDARF